MLKDLNEYYDKTYDQEYCSGVFSDNLDKLGFREQVTNGWRLNNSQLRMFGRVRTLTLETIETDDERIQKGLGFLGSLDNGDVLVVKGSNDYAYFGELMSRLSEEVGVSGAVIDGLTRDTFYTQNISFPIVAKGYSPKDIKGRGRVQNTDCDVEVDGIVVSSGDYVFADSDATVFIPAAVIDKLLPMVFEEVKTEANIKKMIAEGKSVKEILEVVDGF